MNTENQEITTQVENTSENPTKKKERNNSLTHWNKLLSLPTTRFTPKQFQEVSNLSKNGASSQIIRWHRKGFVKRLSMGEYERIVDSIDKTNENKKYSCKECPRTFKSKQSLVVHQFRAHTENGWKLSEKIGFSNKNRINSSELKEIILKDIKKVNFCPCCGVKIKVIEAAINLE